MVFELWLKVYHLCKCYTYVSMHPCIHPCIHVSIYAFMGTPMYPCIYLCIYVSMYASMHLCNYVCICFHVSLYLCIYVSTNLSMHIRMQNPEANKQETTETHHKKHQKCYICEALPSIRFNRRSCTRISCHQLLATRMTYFRRLPRRLLYFSNFIRFHGKMPQRQWQNATKAIAKCQKKLFRSNHCKQSAAEKQWEDNRIMPC